MASASSSSSAVRSVFATRSSTLNSVRSTRSRSKLPEAQCRAFAAAAAVETQPELETPLARSSQQPSSSSRPRPFPITTSNTSVTPAIAQSYLSNLLRLPDQRQFPPDLALQILTHKSYRHVHAIRHARTELEAEAERSSVPHNSRLSFLGRRAIASYLALFVHEAIGTSSKLKDIDFLRGRSLEEKLEALRHVNNLGREVGGSWDIQSVMRWDRNQTGTESGHAKIKGMAVESVLGGIFTQYGSSAAHRAFHLHLLPYLTHQFRDQALKERIEVVRSDVEKQYAGGVLLP